MWSLLNHTDLSQVNQLSLPSHIKIFSGSDGSKTTQGSLVSEIPQLFCKFCSMNQVSEVELRKRSQLFGPGDVCEII